MSDLASALSDLSDLAAAKGPACSVATLLEQLGRTDPEGSAALVAAIENLTVPAVGLSQRLIAHGINLRPHTIRRHRKRHSGAGCSCPTAS